ncbi:hypothetical protein A2U01_0072142, partial [Trifolium medium]|nr:hypothetical protein [Trifolium medium]
RCFFSVSGVTGDVFRHLPIVILHRREDGVVLPKGRRYDSVMIVVDVSV